MNAPSVRSEPMWAYEEYSEWARLLAVSTSSTKDLERRLVKAERATDRAKTSHLRAIQGTASMQGQSSRRASTRTSMVASYEEAKALRDALELRRLYPEKCKATPPHGAITDFN